MGNVVFKLTGLYPADPNKCYEELQSIGESYTAAEVVEKAKDPNTELHKCFTWDDTEAAQKWRVQEARVLIANIVYVKDEETQEPSLIRAVHFSTEEKVYKPIVFTIRKQDEYEALLERAKQDLDAFERKYVALGNLEEILRLIA